MKERFTRREFLRMTSKALALAACKPLSTEPEPKAEPTPELPGISDLDFPLSADMYLLLGPHYKGRDEGVRYAIDVTSLDKNAKVVAAKYGTVIVAGDAMVEVDIGDGYTLEYVHVGNIKVKVGDTVHRGVELGEMTLESPQGGSSDRLHLHLGIKRYGKPIKIDGRTIEGLIIKEGQNPGDGTMKKDDEYAIDNYTVTANPNLCGPSKESIRACGGIINFLPHPKIARPGVTR